MSVTSSPAAELVAVEHVGKTVVDATGQFDILTDIDFSLAQGQTLAIAGASGSGKSTLLSIIAGLDVPTRGTVRLAGQDLFALNEDDRAAWRASKLGFVFQSFQLLNHLSALENVMLPLELAGRRDARARATDMLDRVGLAQRAGAFPRVLSGGEQQRVALARAFVVQPALLLADEPTGSLDFATGESVMQLMLRLNREQGTTLVLVTHDRGIAARCERRITLQAGRIVADDQS
ncbi:MAG: ABC transporter [Comamonas sp. SCN 67-35]|mgnify:FL=1|uniref:ABC transporter ATP-binding protein n=1 Tax=unclassified Comamonas TaxID=2638500 RepID=UPI00086E0642|nr:MULTISPECIES: ABC transporter ATP-binding protein [unclassified Comamonas]MBN9329572.1 ABC transporter ATP-binding protein [Comamonas sp.]ODU37594.1 MAG: ABC transporter [Comamonas sp. SCN 67-35]OJW96075.1 MAG: ABC transporter [Burkholderiales bacterium 66-26]